MVVDPKGLRETPSGNGFALPENANRSAGKVQVTLVPLSESGQLALSPRIPICPWTMMQNKDIVLSQILACLAGCCYNHWSADPSDARTQPHPIRTKEVPPMLKSRCVFRYVSVFILTVVTAIIGSPAPVTAGSTGVLVPAYFYPGTGGPGGVGDGWAAMTAAAGTIPVTAIFNPDSGPLPGPPDPNYVNAMTNLEKAGGTVVAYIPSSFGSTPLATIESDIQTYITQYGNLIKGFFIDQMNILPSTLSYYQDIDNSIKSLGSSYTVVGNPGSPFLNGVSPQDFLSTANVLNIFEGPNIAPAPGAPGFDAYPYGLNWFLNYPSNRFSNIVFDVPADAGNPSGSSAMLADLSKAVQLNAGYVYVTDQTLPNPYAQLPSYWDQEVAAIASVPEPSSVTIMAVGCMLTTLGIAVRRRARRLRQPR